MLFPLPHTSVGCLFKRAPLSCIHRQAARFFHRSSCPSTAPGPGPALVPRQKRAAKPGEARLRERCPFPPTVGGNGPFSTCDGGGLGKPMGQAWRQLRGRRSTRAGWALLLHALPRVRSPCPCAQTPFPGRGRAPEHGSCRTLDQSIPEGECPPGQRAPGRSGSTGAPVTRRCLEEPHVATKLLHAPRPAPKFALVFLPQICFISLGA